MISVQEKILKYVYVDTMQHLYVSFSVHILEYRVPWKADGEMREFWMMLPVDFFPGCFGFLVFFLCQWSLFIYRIIEWVCVYVCISLKYQHSSIYITQRTKGCVPLWSFNMITSNFNSLPVKKVISSSLLTICMNNLRSSKMIFQR